MEDTPYSLEDDESFDVYLDRSPYNKDVPVATNNNIEVSLSKGEKYGDGLSAYYTYTITTRTTLKQFRQAEFSKQRRYRDFVWLHDHLVQNYKGVIVPTLPEKTVIPLDRFGPDFLEYRRRELEKFLKRVVEHPLLSQSRHLQLFLEAPETELGDAKTVAQPPGMASQFATFFGMKITNTLSPPVEMDPWFQSKTRYINTLETQMNGLATHFNNLLVKNNELAELYFNVSEGVRGLSTTEKESDQHLADNYNAVSQVYFQMQSLNQELSQQSKICFLDTIRDYTRLIASAKDMLNFRNEKMSVYQEALVAYKNKKDKLDKLKETSAPLPPNAEVEVQKLENDAQKKKDLFDSVSKTARSELERFETQKTKEFVDAISALVQANMNYQVRAVGLWKGLLSKITPDT